MKLFYPLFICILLSNTAFSQSTLYGKVTSKETGEELIYANIVLTKDNIFTTGCSSDFEGNYSMPVDVSIYELKVSYTGYFDTLITDVIIKNKHKTKLDILLSKNMQPAINACSGIPLIQEIDAGATLSPEELKNLPTKKCFVLKATDAALSPIERDSSVHLKREMDKFNKLPNPKEKKSDQSYIQGKVTDEETGEELLYANIELQKDDLFIAGGTTDFEGNYAILIAPGVYTLKLSYTGYPDRTITNVTIGMNQTVTLDISISLPINICDILIPVGYRIPLIEQDHTTSGQIMDSEQIRHQPVKEIKDIILNAPGVSFNNF